MKRPKLAALAAFKHHVCISKRAASTDLITTWLQHLITTFFRKWHTRHHTGNSTQLEKPNKFFDKTLFATISKMFPIFLKILHRWSLHCTVAKTPASFSSLFFFLNFSKFFLNFCKLFLTFCIFPSSITGGYCSQSFHRTPTQRSSTRSGGSTILLWSSKWTTQV